MAILLVGMLYFICCSRICIRKSKHIFRHWKKFQVVFQHVSLITALFPLWSALKYEVTRITAVTRVAQFYYCEGLDRSMPLFWLWRGALTRPPPREPSPQSARSGAHRRCCCNARCCCVRNRLLFRRVHPCACVTTACRCVRARSCACVCATWESKRSRHHSDDSGQEIRSVAQARLHWKPDEINVLEHVNFRK